MINDKRKVKDFFLLFMHKIRNDHSNQNDDIQPLTLLFSSQPSPPLLLTMIIIKRKDSMENDMQMMT